MAVDPENPIVFIADPQLIVDTHEPEDEEPIEP